METRCEVCGSADVVRITMRLEDESRIAMTACHRCESKVWRAPEGRLSLEQVLELASTRGPR